MAVDAADASLGPPSPVQERVEVSLIPPTSPFASAVRDAARAAGADFVRCSVERPEDVEGRVLVVDLTELRPDRPLSGRVIALSQRLDLDCYDVVPPDQVRWRLARAVRNLVERERLEARLRSERGTIRTLNEIGYALSAQPTQAALLDLVLSRARQVLSADGGSIYLVDRDAGTLRFANAQNDSQPFRPNRQLLPLDDSSLAGRVATTGKALLLEDAQAIPLDAPWRPSFRFDHETGYQTRSLLLVPMLDRDEEVIGVLALVNRKAAAGRPLTGFDRVQAFTEHDGELLGSIASQAAVAIENHRLYRDIRNLFDGFVNAAVTAIEARDPSTGGHSHRVAALTDRLARAVDEAHSGPYAAQHFSPQELTELHYAAMLHDFGKVGVREQVLLKAHKLYSWEMDAVEARFRIAALQVMLEGVEASLAREDTRDRLALLQRDLSLVRRLNRPGEVPTPGEIQELFRISAAWHLAGDGSPLLQPEEVDRLTITHGSLDADERREIQKHVSHTHHFLTLIPWTRDLRRVPELAWAHHEKLDGSGYPRGLKGDEIPLGARLMTVADIFDALTAGDRPYKPGMPAEAAVTILRDEAARMHIEAEAVELFAARRLWLDLPRGA